MVADISLSENRKGLFTFNKFYMKVINPLLKKMQSKKNIQI